MTDAKHGLQFLERGVGMVLDVRLKLLRIELAPSPPTGFGRQRSPLGGGQIPINGTAGQVKPPGGLGFGAAALDEFDHPFPQIQRIGFHARKLISLCPNVNMKYYSLKMWKRSVEFTRRFQTFLKIVNAARLELLFDKPVHQNHSETGGLSRLHNSGATALILSKPIQ